MRTFVVVSTQTAVVADLERGSCLYYLSLTIPFAKLWVVGFENSAPGGSRRSLKLVAKPETHTHGHTAHAPLDRVLEDIESAARASLARS